MARERTWIDYANLGSNIAQNLQLHHTNQTLEELQRTATASALNERENRQTDEREARLREHVFQLAEDIEGLQRHLHELPCAALALGIQIKGMLKKNNVTTASFRAWEDKDRLKKVVNGLDDVCEKSASQLTEGQREEAEKCAKYLTEGDALNQLISVQREKEKFQRERESLERSLDINRKRSENAKLKSEQSSIKYPMWATVCIGVGLLGAGFSFLWFIVLGLMGLDDDTAPQFTTVLFACGIFLISIVVSLIPVFRPTPAIRRYDELTIKIISLDPEIASANAELARFDSKSPIRGTSPMSVLLGRDIWKEAEETSIALDDSPRKWATQARLEELYAMFGGDLPSEAYEQMKREREAFINKVFGKSDAAAIAL